jgi:alkane 1-monooxygenase
MTRTVPLFAFATLLPVPLLIGAALGGAGFGLVALFYITALVLILDALMSRGGPADDEDNADILLQALGWSHFVLLALAVWAIGGDSGLGWFDRLVAFFAFGLYFGQVSNSNAHELIHDGHPPLHRLGMWVYISLLFGHHTTAHPAVHHRFVATPLDPNSARRGESYWRFLPRAWRGSFRAGWAVEVHRLEQRGLPRLHWRNAYLTYGAGAVLCLVLAWMIAGLPGIAAHLALAVYAQAQLLLSDYVQHYGLTRRALPDGRWVPVGAGHSWNAPHWASGLLMLNAPRHSDHHAHPSKPYPTLEEPAPGTAPMLPLGLPAMGAIALWPRRWFRMMDPRLDRWQAAAEGAGQAA